MVAVMKAVAVCPEGKEWLFEPSGRVTWVVCLSVLTTLPINKAENASDASMRPHELRLSTPPIFIPSITAAGRYCR